MSMPSAEERLAELIARHAATLGLVGGPGEATRSGVVNLGPGDVDPLTGNDRTAFQRAGATDPLGALGRVGDLSTELFSPVPNAIRAAQGTDPVGSFFGDFDPRLSLPDALVDAGLPANLATLLIGSAGEFALDPDLGDAARLAGRLARGVGGGDFLGFSNLPEDFLNRRTSGDRRQSSGEPVGGVERRAGDRRVEGGGFTAFGEGASMAQDFQTARINQVFNELAEQGRTEVLEGVQDIFRQLNNGAISTDEASTLLHQLDSDVAQAFDETRLFDDIEQQFSNDSVVRLMQSDPNIRTVQEARDFIAAQPEEFQRALRAPRTRDVPLDEADVDPFLQQLVGFDPAMAEQARQVAAGGTPEEIANSLINAGIVDPDQAGEVLRRLDEVDVDRVMSMAVDPDDIPTGVDPSTIQPALDDPVSVRTFDQEADLGERMAQDLRLDDPARFTDVTAMEQQLLGLGSSPDLAPVASEAAQEAASRSLTHVFTGQDNAAWLGAVARAWDEELPGADPELLKQVAAGMAQFSQRGEPVTGMDMITVMARIPGLSNEDASKILRIGALGLFGGK